MIAAAGGVEHEWLVARVEAAFSHLQGASGAPQSPSPRPHIGLGVHNKKLEQVQLMLGVPGLSVVDEERYAAFVLNTALGDGMSSRLFQEVREKRGKAYSIYSYLDSFSDAGCVGVYAALGAAAVPEVVDVVRSELQKVVAEGLEDGELERAKNQIKGGMLLGLESTASRMRRLALNEIYFGRDVAPSEVSESISAVGSGDVRNMAERLFASGNLAATLLGDVPDSILDPAALHLG